MKKKFLSDGRKVVIVGKLNNQETIVQEIFVTENGSEVPSGENFVVKSLHDEPVLSYQEKQAKKTEALVVKWEKDLKDIQDKYKKARHDLDAIRDIVRSSNKLVDLLPESELDVFTSFLTGTIEYLVVDGYTITAPVKMIDKIISWDGGLGWNNPRYDSIKLVSALGKSNGNLEYRIHQYYDGSGSNTKVYPFTKESDALEFIKALAEGKIEKDRLGNESYETCIKMGIVFSDEHKEKYEKQQAAALKDAISRAEGKVLKAQNELDKLLG